jgi:hypothetical protein
LFLPTFAVDWCYPEGKARGSTWLFGRARLARKTLKKYGRISGPMTSAMLKRATVEVMRAALRQCLRWKNATGSITA